MSGGGSFQVSPGVLAREIDATNVIPAVSTAIGAFAGSFTSGPVESPVLIGSEQELAKVFGVPTAANSLDFLTAASFLKYSNALWVSRAIRSDAQTASDTGAVGVIKNDDDFQRFLNDSPAPTQSVVARYPGISGNDVSLRFNAWKGGSAIERGFDYEPDATTTRELTEQDILDGFTGEEGDTVPTNRYDDGEYIYDEVHVEVLLDGLVVEKYTGLSIAADAKDERGANIFFKDVLNRDSNYVRIVNITVGDVGADSPVEGNIVLNKTFAELTALSDEFDSPFGNPTDAQQIPTYLNETTYALSGGAEGVGTVDGVTAIEAFADAETVDVSLLFTSVVEADGYEWSATEQALNTIVTTRKDCVGFISAPLQVAKAQSDADKLSLVFKDAVEGKFSYSGSKHNSYLMFDSSPVEVYNKYLDRNEWIPASGHMAGLCANTDLVADPWFSPAGFNRGRVKGISRIAYNPKKAERDTLYKGGVNFMTSFPGEGIVLYGDKTGQTKPSAFDRINVRRLFIVLEKAIAKAAKYQLFELNDEFTRATFRNMVIPFLREIQGRRGVTDFAVVCDSTNNTGEIIDTNQFVGDIYIKPARSINFITLNFVATRTGVEFKEIIGS